MNNKFFLFIFRLNLKKSYVLYDRIIERKVSGCMTREDIEGIVKVCGKGIEMSKDLLNNTYDFGKVRLSNEILNLGSLNDKIDFEMQKIKEEMNRQALILCEAKKIVKEKYPDCYITDYICKVISYKNYYLIRLYGSPFEKIELIYYKSGKLLSSISKDYGHIDAIDDRSFFVLERKAKRYIAVHKRINCIDTCCINERVFDNVCSAILPVAGKNLDIELGKNLVSWCNNCGDSVESKKFVLYNHTIVHMMVSEFTDVKYRDGYLEVINRIDDDEGAVAELHFLVDDDGVIRSKVWDSVSGNEYLLTDRFDNNGKPITAQAALLSNIFDEVRTNLEKKYSSGLSTLKHKKDN